MTPTEFVRQYLPYGYVHVIYDDLPRHVMGRCSRMSDGTIWIALDLTWSDHPGFMRDSVLWHEICHARNYIEDGTAGHGITWIRRLWAKPAYAIGDLIASVAYVWWRSHNERVRDRRHPTVDG